MTTNRNLLATVVAVALLGACSGDKANPTEPPPTGVKTGTATFAIASAPETLGAIRLRVSGPGMSNLTVKGSAKIIGQRTVADTTTLLLSVTSGAGPFIDVTLANKDIPPSAVVQEATAGSLDGYRALTANMVVLSTTVR